MLKFNIFQFIVSMFQFVVFGFGIYAFVLFIRFCTRGIKAFDLYIAEKTNKDMTDKN
ncbi:hypothetical protein JHL18_05925 [Clostridium sp. YIM B02505]|uniref:DUF4083 domain-containing protein n=1 Tax=Clostridium yunnanense TaxID=2800325 RepID=A0ABS1ELC1_9CLOT|nr:hypothetical protein [Clostridium yunnanense]MBK1810173.1 hypothetical protein [Clostridium yunnanense]